MSSTELSFEDTTAAPGITYNYWIKAANTFGESSFSDSNTGSAGGIGGGVVNAYEPFDYTVGDNIQGKNDGIGWANAWNIRVPNGSLTVNNFGLEYDNLQTSGNSLNFKPNADTPEIVLERNTTGQVGAEGVPLWMSFLIKANNVGSGHVSLFGNNAFLMGLFKEFGSSIFSTLMQEGETYFVVYQFESSPGNDLARYWLNPEIGIIPSPSNTARVELNRDLGTGNRIAINIQGFGRGDYDIDEIRVGSTFEDVMPPSAALSVDDKLFDNTIKIYPNPFSSELQINLNNISSNYSKFVLYDISGKTVKTSKLNAESDVITIKNLSELPSGVYVLKLFGDNNLTFNVIHK